MMHSTSCLAQAVKGQAPCKPTLAAQNTTKIALMDLSGAFLSHIDQNLVSAALHSLIVWLFAILFCLGHKY